MMMEHFYYQEIYNIILNGNFKIPKSDLRNYKKIFVFNFLFAIPSKLKFFLNSIDVFNIIC